ncbi:MAG: RnfABCDGE type electron transport complex subunit D [Clostridiales bacterium]|nr:RnfABCDGE type electron transport complex subunit D [Clostridiales bacterium]
MSTLTNKLTVAPSPHIKDKATTSSLMLSVIIALVPAAVASVVIFGISSLVLIATCVIACVVSEYLFNLLCKKPQTVGDLSAVVTGILLAFNLPSTFPVWMAVVGSVAAIMVVKGLFGGIGQNFANPAITGRVILLISFAGPMTSFLVPQKIIGGYELVSGATPLALNAAGEVVSIPSYLDMFLGLRGGSLGETCILALLVGGIFLIVRGVISPIIPVSYLATVAVFALLVGEDPIFHLLAGGVVLGAFFMATDYVTSPVTDKGKLIFGIGCGLITMLIRVFGSYPEGTSFAILLMNILTPHIDNLTKSKPFGGVIK